jgi:hypothetical protein
MILPSPNFNKFMKFFKANQDLMAAHSAMNKATNELMGMKFYSNDTKKTWRVINAYEKGNFLSRSYQVWIEDLSTELKFWTWQRLKYGWKHPRMMIPVEVLAEKFDKGILVAIEYEWDMTKHFSEKDIEDANIISVED